MSSNFDFQVELFNSGIIHDTTKNPMSDKQPNLQRMHNVNQTHKYILIEDEFSGDKLKTRGSLNTNIHFTQMTWRHGMWICITFTQPSIISVQM